MASAENRAPIPMTAAGIEALKVELEELKARRPSMVNEVANARSQGDLSENFAYHDARQHLGMLDGRIQTIENSLRRAELVVEVGRQDAVGIGSRVVVRDEFGESTYQVVGPTEGNMAKGLLSVASPLGSALVDRRPGDTVSFATPGGPRQATLVSIG
ncbi:MAG TPA: transcription elongation factor GreA [Candidatus Dormibacteraeota bacterium]|nr:transcription elongation factor GreA [Candidatus Dormibacteraeota bacterium]